MSKRIVASISIKVNIGRIIHIGDAIEWFIQESNIC